MINKLIFISLALFVFVACKNEASTSDKKIDKENATLEQKMSYGTGSMTAEQLRADSAFIDFEYFLQGIKDKLQNKELLFAEDEIMEAYEKHGAQKKKQELGITDADINSNKEKGNAFLEENKTKPDVVTTESGMQYIILNGGTGALPTMKDRIHFQIKVYNLDGQVIDDTHELADTPRNHVAAFFPGLQEAALMMQEGSKWKIFLNSDLAAGDLGIQGKFPPGATLILEFELIDIIPKGSPTNK
jgi:FKBP-type peptidyl-prolyl cis-trans isomerase